MTTLSINDRYEITFSIPDKIGPSQYECVMQIYRKNKTGGEYTGISVKGLGSSSARAEADGRKQVNKRMKEIIFAEDGVDS